MKYTGYMIIVVASLGGLLWYPRAFLMMNNNQALVETFNHGFSYDYGIMAILSGIFIWKFLPEMKGKSIEEMEILWIPKDKL